MREGAGVDVLVYVNGQLVFGNGGTSATQTTGRGEGKIDLHIAPRVTPWVGEFMRKMCEDVERVVRLEHKVRVKVRATNWIGCNDDWCCGYFDEDGPQIVIAGNDHTKADLTETLLHELVHYEQFRDGREGTERGVAVRVRTLLAQLRAVGAGQESPRATRAQAGPEQVPPAPAPKPAPPACAHEGVAPPYVCPCPPSCPCYGGPCSGRFTLLEVD